MTSESPEQVRHHAKVLAYHDTGSGDFEATCLRFAEHFRQWVPDRGQAETVSGEVLRAVARLAGEWRRNGNGNWGPMFEDLVDTLRDALLDEPALAPRHAEIQRDLDRVCAAGRGDGSSLGEAAVGGSGERLEVAFGRLIEDAVAFVEVPGR
ncbi:MAG: hypothetical protein ABMA64_07770 [Myxococcota bacterium]